MTLQFTAYLNASSQAAYESAFKAFYSAISKTTGTVAQAASFIFNNRGDFPTASNQSIAKTLNTPQAMAVGLYMSEGNPSSLTGRFPNADVTKSGSSVLFTNLESALTSAMSGAQAAPVSTPIVTPTVTPPTVTPTVTTEPTATDVAATTLRAQLDSGVAIYNTYLTSKNLPQIKIATA